MAFRFLQDRAYRHYHKLYGKWPDKRLCEEAVLDDPSATEERLARLVRIETLRREIDAAHAEIQSEQRML